MRLKLTFILLLALSTTNAIAQSYLELNEKMVSLFQAANYQEAAEAGLASLVACEEEYGKDHEEYLFSLQNLAIIYDKLEEPEKALEYYDLAIITYEKVLPNALEEQALQANDAALIANNLGNWEKSGQYFIYAQDSYIQLWIDPFLDKRCKDTPPATHHLCIRFLLKKGFQKIFTVGTFV